MKKLALIAATAFAALALAACSDAEEAAPVVEETTEPAAAAATFVDGGPAYGTFEVSSNDGTVLTQVLAEDGTQVTTDAEGTATAGTFTAESPERYCRMDGEETEWTCYAEAIGEDGTWTATNEADPDEVWTVVRVE